MQELKSAERFSAYHHPWAGVKLIHIFRVIRSYHMYGDCRTIGPEVYLTGKRIHFRVLVIRVGHSGL